MANHIFFSQLNYFHPARVFRHQMTTTEGSQHKRFFLMHLLAIPANKSPFFSQDILSSISFPVNFSTNECPGVANC